MDAYEATRIVFSRIQALDPDNAAKIMGLLLIQDHGDKEMIRLAFGPETLLHTVVVKARNDLGLLHPPPPPSSSTPSTPSSLSPSPFLLSRHNSLRIPNTNASSTGCSSPSSWSSQPHPFSRSSNSTTTTTTTADQELDGDQQPQQQLMMGSEYLLQEHLSFLNEQQAAGVGDPLYWGDHQQHQRSCLSPDGTGGGGGFFGWKPCLYFARGFCKNGSSCRFLHGPADDISAAAAAAVEQQCQELMLMRSKSQRLMSSAAVAAAAAAFPYSPTGSSGSSSAKTFNFMMQQQNETQRAAATVAAALMLENESHKFMGRVRMDRTDFAGMVNPGSRQIYLTFPADSTFREEDVSNYFSIYGPVQDVRIPYQQKRMFGFVTFVFPETVKLILAKGNPHFVCDARVLVKPYKEKGKVPDKKQQQQQQQQQGERVDFGTPTGLDSRDPYDLQQLASSRLLYGGNSQEALLRRKMAEEQQAAAELQQAIEMQGRRFMGLQLLDFKNHRSMSSNSLTAPLLSPLATTIPTTTSTTTFINTSTTTAPLCDGRSSNGSQDETFAEDKSVSPASGTASALSNAAAADKSDHQHAETNPYKDIHFQESGVAEEHNLPESPFASPTKSSFAPEPFTLAIANGDDDDDNNNEDGNNVNGNGHLIASSLLSPLPHLKTWPHSSLATSKCPGSLLDMEQLVCRLETK